MKKISLKNWFVTPTLYSSCAMVPNRKTVRSLDSLPIAGTSDDWNRGFDSFQPLARPLMFPYTHELGVLKTSFSTSSDPVYGGMPGLYFASSSDPLLANTSPRPSCLLVCLSACVARGMSAISVS